MEATFSAQRLHREMLALASERGHGKTFCPSELARRLGPPDDWRALMPQIRQAARELVDEGRLAATQRGQTLDVDETWRGAIRLGLPPGGENSGQTR
ncbi:DUF3253 domain-containing protein [Salinicola rhizosphaerae]|uniref:DUF3253 domain-containing protein n=1 Tax=Salinicola rhizosphaerae TaxID=1443141 RepID=A0ABQ3E056_9GAMM|nr:DUF3253 domain-containing protein [Salinicola rhizosphaerae]GHB22036.1 hypothetical protein GCM10009038_21200 [Salinicola rhizosphaerae]